MRHSLCANDGTIAAPFPVLLGAIKGVLTTRWWDCPSPSTPEDALERRIAGALVDRVL